MKKVSILIPCYNEENTVLPLIERVMNSNTLGLEKEIIVINDGSTDQTSAILESLPSSIKVIHLERNSGKGHAIEKSKEQVSGDLVIIQDADLEYSPEDYPQLIQPFFERNCDAVFGVRNRKGLHPKFILNPYFWGGYFINTSFNLLSGTKLEDLHVGYKLIRSKLFLNIAFSEAKFNFCHELAWTLVSQNIYIHQVPISYSPRTIKQGKKIRAKDGVSAVIFLVRKFIEKKKGRYEPS